MFFQRYRFIVYVPKTGETIGCKHVTSATDEIRFERAVQVPEEGGSKTLREALSDQGPLEIWLYPSETTGGKVRCYAFEGGTADRFGYFDLDATKDGVAMEWVEFSPMPMFDVKDMEVEEAPEYVQSCMPGRDEVEDGCR